MNWNIGVLPTSPELETRGILKQLPGAHAALAELKGLASTIPNQTILVNTLSLQEAKDSSAIENIVTTHDELYKTELKLKAIASLEAKEVQNYIGALKRGYDLVAERGLLTNSIILEVQEMLERNRAGFRKLPGTALKNAVTGEVIYTPPQDALEIGELMAELQLMINDHTYSDYDPLVKMAIIHFQFESIHPFYDGNGRTGRIINILYLILNDLLDLPILYLSSYIISNKGKYYAYLQQVRETNDWEAWIKFIIQGVMETAQATIATIREIKRLMQEMKILLRDNYRFYSQDLLNSLFKHPYTKIGFVQEDLQVTRTTASNYLNQLAKDGVLRKSKVGNTNYYVNDGLFDLLRRV